MKRTLTFDNRSQLDTPIIRYLGCDVILTKERYDSNDNLAIIATCLDGEPFATLTVNTVKLAEDEACLDTNNLPGIQACLLENGLIALTGRYVQSGFCTYPIVRFKQTTEGGAL